MTQTIATKSQPGQQAFSLANLRTPSNRDLEIYKRVKISGYKQWEVAADEEIHYTRVSQIIKRVNRWLAAGGEAIDPALRNHAARQHFSRATCKLRLARAAELASMALEFNQPVKTTRRRVQGISEIWREETTRELPRINVSALKLLLDATQALQRLEQQQSPPAEAPASSDNDLLRAVFDLLCGWRARAESQGRLAATSDISTLVSDALSGLLGLSKDQLFDPTPAPQPTAQEQLNLSAEAVVDPAATNDPQPPSAELPCAVASSLERSTPPDPTELCEPATCV